YDLPPTFAITRVPAIDLVRYGKWGFLIQYATFVIFSSALLLRRGRYVIYSRDDILLWCLSWLTSNFFWEAHRHKWNFVARRIAGKSRGIIVITNAMKEYFKEKGVLEAHLLVAHDAVDTSVFCPREDKAAIRKTLSLPVEKKIIGYVGKYTTLGRGKGVGELIGIFAELHQRRKDLFLVLVGINAGEYQEVKALFESLSLPEDAYKIVLHVPQKEAAKYLSVSDALVMNYPRDGHYVRFMSPMKLFEYMASGVPVVASDLPAIREVLDETMAYLSDPDLPDSLLRSVLSALESEDEAKRRAVSALVAVEKHTWEKRAEKILPFISGGVKREED
ncbi:glycosyltransferase, partial [bacterium]|nr:glycosyltransferase [bacterium]